MFFPSFKAIATTLAVDGNSIERTVRNKWINARLVSPEKTIDQPSDKNRAPGREWPAGNPVDMVTEQ